MRSEAYDARLMAGSGSGSVNAPQDALGVFRQSPRLSVFLVALLAIAYVAIIPALSVSLYRASYHSDSTATANGGLSQCAQCYLHDVGPAVSTSGLLWAIDPSTVHYQPLNSASTPLTILDLSITTNQEPLLSWAVTFNTTNTIRSAYLIDDFTVATATASYSFSLSYSFDYPRLIVGPPPVAAGVRSYYGFVEYMPLPFVEVLHIAGMMRFFNTSGGVLGGYAYQFTLGIDGSPMSAEEQRRYIHTATRSE